MARKPRRPGAKLFSRTPVWGGWTSWGHPSITEVLARAGLNFIGLDLEHSTISQEQAQRLIAASQAAGVACLPRVASHNGEQIRQVLDSGADGIIVPNVATPAQVRQLIDWCKFPPVGRRSYGVSRAHGYGLTFEAYVRQWNDRSSLILQIESVEGAEAIEELLAPPAVDGVMVGPYDMSGALGVPGELDHPRVRAACRKVIEACRRQGKACGTQLVEPTAAGMRQALARGFTFVVLASDVFILWKWAERMQRLTAGVRR